MQLKDRLAGKETSFFGAYLTPPPGMSRPEVPSMDKHLGLLGSAVVIGSVILAMTQPAAATRNLFLEGFGTSSLDGCTVGLSLNGYNGWAAVPNPPDLTNHEYAVCDAADLWPGKAANDQYLAMSESPATATVARAAHSFSAPSGKWSAQVDFWGSSCNKAWGTDFFSILKLGDMARVGFTDNNWALDVFNGTSSGSPVITHDVYTLTCNAQYTIRLTFPPSPSTTYTLDVLNSGQSVVFTDNYTRASTTTPTDVLSGVVDADATGHDSGSAGFDNYAVKDQL